MCRLARESGVSRLNSDERSPWLAVCRCPFVSAPSWSSRRAMVRQEAALGLQVRRHEHELGRARLVGPVDPAHPLHAPRAAPARLDAVEHAALLVLGREVGVVAPAGAPGLAEDEDPALARHELVGLGVARPPGPPLLDDLLDAVDGLA